MTAAFTLCSNNYYAQALALANSFLRHHPDSEFYIVLVDKQTEKIVCIDSRVKIIEIEVIEPAILSLAQKYNIIELNTAVKPQVFLYLFSNTLAECIYYLDPDIYIYESFHELRDFFETDDILLTPHILSPIPIDDKTPFENDFLNFGLYNLGFLGLKKSKKTMELLLWWKARTYQYGYKNLAKGLFVDQIWMNLVPIIHEKVKIVQHPGYNMGPWNLHERMLSNINGRYFVNGEHPLFFFHFSTLNPLKKLKLHPVFNRFDFTNRTDLLKLYEEYAKELMELGFADFHSMPCYYVEWRAKENIKAERAAYNLLPLKMKVFRKMKNVFPEKFRKAIHVFIDN